MMSPYFKRGGVRIDDSIPAFHIEKHERPTYHSLHFDSTKKVVIWEREESKIQIELET